MHHEHQDVFAVADFEELGAQRDFRRHVEADRRQLCDACSQAIFRDRHGAEIDNDVSNVTDFLVPDAVDVRIQRPQ
ncbi:hypothetical protein RERY_66380 [Rhodococcus erythropolis]|nr:hypothetical protein RERY_66380 [Rhodococcus erythropolis]